MAFRTYFNAGVEDLDGDFYTPYNQRPETYVVPVIFFLIFVVGFLGNGTLVVIFLRHAAMRTVPNTYILSLALADLLVVITCVPFTSIVYTMENWPWGELMCKISETAKDTGIGVSVFTLTALSVERYCAIVKPLRRMQTKPMTAVSAIVIWIVASTLAIPDAIFSRLAHAEIHGNKTVVYCSPFPSSTYTQYNVVFKSLVYYIVPLCVIAYFYILMAVKLHNQIPGETQGMSHRRSRRHVARLVLIIVFLFFICFLPNHIFILWFHLNPRAEEEFDDWWSVLRIIGFCLSFLNSCVNPVALYCVSGVFRAHFNRYLCFKSWDRGGGDPESSYSSQRRRTQ